MTKKLANRVSEVIHTLISEDRSCCVPGRSIADNVILIDNIIQSLEENNTRGYILKIGVFHSVEHLILVYLSNVLEKMG